MLEEPCQRACQAPSRGWPAFSESLLGVLRPSGRSLACGLYSLKRAAVCGIVCPGAKRGRKPGGSGASLRPPAGTWLLPAVQERPCVAVHAMPGPCRIWHPRLPACSTWASLERRQRPLATLGATMQSACFAYAACRRSRLPPAVCLQPCTPAQAPPRPILPPVPPVHRPSALRHPPLIRVYAVWGPGRPPTSMPGAAWHGPSAVCVQYMRCGRRQPLHRPLVPMPTRLYVLERCERSFKGMQGLPRLARCRVQGGQASWVRGWECRRYSAAPAGTAACQRMQLLAVHPAAAPGS